VVQRGGGRRPASRLRGGSVAFNAFLASRAGCGVFFGPGTFPSRLDLLLRPRCSRARVGTLTENERRIRIREGMIVAAGRSSVNEDCTRLYTARSGPKQWLEVARIIAKSR